VIGSPEAQNVRGELLDMERELARILDAVEPARKEGKAMVRVLETGSVKAIREALSAQRYHVLHISCHAGPGVLVLEDEEGSEDRVDAERFCKEVLVPDRGVPLVVLAGCATALAGSRAGDEETAPAAHLPSLARELLARGVPAVVAMQAPVSDRYATLLGDQFYKALATQADPNPLVAFSHARRSVEEMRRQETETTARQDLAEWATPALYLRGPSQPLYDTTAKFESIVLLPESRFAPGIMVRRVGEFVGRRREQRLLLRALRDPDRAGVLIHAMGGVGKSSLAAQVLQRLAEEGRVLVSLVGPLSTDSLLAAVGKRIFSLCLERGWDEKHPWRQLSTLLQQPDMDWRDRFDLLSQHILGTLDLVFLLDNFEDNLKDGGRLTDENVAELLALWVNNPGRSRFSITCRYPFSLPDEAESRLEALHLGPLSLAETRKLVWRLPGLDALVSDELRRAYEKVGGHPRALEYLDALLRGGKAARFPDVEQRLTQALRNQHIADPSRWRADKKGNLDLALAEVVTLAADDVLLDALLARLDPIPLARELLLGASVYRVPVDEVALIWQVGEESAAPVDPQRTQRLQAFIQAMEQVKSRGEKPALENLGLSQQDIQQALLDLQQTRRPPVNAPENMVGAREALEELGLLAPVQLVEDSDRSYTVHRWTAGALARRSSPQDLRLAHHRAARYWRWRVNTVSQSRQQDIEELLEARYHHHQAGEIDEAIEVTEEMCSQLDTWGAWDREKHLCQEVLTWIPERSAEAVAFLRQLGVVAQNRGAYDEALEWCRKSLTIAEELGDRAGMARSYGQLAVFFTERGAPEEGLPLNLSSLTIHLELESPNAGFNLRLLTRQRELLGEERFLSILHQQLDEESVQAVLSFLEQFTGEK